MASSKKGTEETVHKIGKSTPWAGEKLVGRREHTEDMLSSHPDSRKLLKALLDEEELILAPGAYDALGARLVEAGGFSAVYMTGFGTAASLLGRPDVGLLGLSEMVDNARRIAQSVGVPVIADADTGYGNSINVIRAVREYERAGVAAIHIEDQVAPKRCGHITGKQVIPAQEMTAKIKAAVEARSSSDFLIIARTDARAVEGLERSLDRARLYREAGADVLFVEAPETKAEIATVARAFPNVPLLFNWIEGGRTPSITYEELKRLGYRIVIFPVSILLSATQAIHDVLETIRSSGTPEAFANRLTPFRDFLEFIGLPEVTALEQRFKETTG